MKKIVLPLLMTLPLIAGEVAFAGTGHPLNEHAKVTSPSGGSSGNPCSFLAANTISSITGLHITKVKNLGDSCVYVDPKAPLSPAVQQFGLAIGKAFSGNSPLRLKGAPEGGVPEPQSGAGVVVRVPSGDDVSTVNVHEYAAGIVAQIPPQAGCGPLRDVSGLNAVSIVCFNGEIGHGGVAKDGEAVQIMYLAPGGSATNTVMARLVRAAAAHM